MSQLVVTGGGTRATSYTYDTNDRLLSEQGDSGAVGYRYDANGSLIEKNEAGGTSLYGYNGAGRLVEVATPTLALLYSYDANGIRQSQSVNGVLTRFVVDPTAEYVQVLEERGAADTVSCLLGHERIVRREAGQLQYLHADGLGSTRLLTTTAGAAADRWWYQAFGDTELHTGSSANAFLFAGEQQDRNLGWYYLRARYMDPRSGRFTQQDSFAGFDQTPVSLHKYLYAYANPVMGTDPSGYMTLGQVGVSINVASNLYTAGSITFSLLTGNYGAAGVAAKEIAQEVVLSKLSYLRPVAKLSDEAAALIGRIWSRTVKLKLGHARSGDVLSHNMVEILGHRPPGTQAHHIVGGAYLPGKITTALLQQHNIDVNSLMNGVFLPDCKKIGMGAVHCGKHTLAYELYVERRLTAVSGDKTAVINELNSIREELLMGTLRLNRH